MSLDSAAEVSPGIDRWQLAAVIAAEGHRGQTSPGVETPYFAHPARVALLVSAVFGCADPEVLAAALLHDVLEKTTMDHAGLAIAMGPNIAIWVGWLSKDPQGDKGEYWKRLAIAPWQVKLIKMADALDHLNGPAEYTEARLKAARKALALVTSSEPELQRAARALEEAVQRLSPS